MPVPTTWYREFAPCKALQDDVYALCSFAPGSAARRPSRPLLREIGFQDASFLSPQLADGHVSLIFELGRTCGADGRWRTDSTAVGGTFIGPMSRVGQIDGRRRSEMFGVYFRPAGVDLFVRTSISNLTDTAVSIGDLWGPNGSSLIEELSELDEAARIDRLESVLLGQLARRRPPTESIDLRRLTACVVRRRGQITVDELAWHAGVSRQHLTRQCRMRLGIGPKLYCRLARFQSGLVYAGSGAGIDWARAAVDLGYADQSHMIAEFRQFSGLTPQALANCDWFHPFIERAKLQGREQPISR